jgi:CBS domain-containing protein
LDVQKTKLKGYVHKTPLIKENTDLLQAAEMFYHTELDYLPVEKDKKIIGVVNSLDVANAVLTLPEFKEMRTNNVKLVKPSKVSTEDKLTKALKIMHNEKIDRVPLFEEGKISGVLSFKDILNEYAKWGPQKDFLSKYNDQSKTKRAQVEQDSMISVPVKSFVVNQQIKTINSMSLLRDAVKEMYINNIHDLVVMDNEQYKGLLTIRSTLRKLASFMDEKDFTIQFNGLKEVNLDASDRYNLQMLAAREAGKLQRKLKQKVALTLHIKEHGKKDNGREKFSITIHAQLAKNKLISEDYDWDPEVAMRKVFDNILNEADKLLSRQLSKDKRIM